MHAQKFLISSSHLCQMLNPTLGWRTTSKREMNVFSELFLSQTVPTCKLHLPPYVLFLGSYVNYLNVIVQCFFFISLKCRHSEVCRWPDCRQFLPFCWYFVVLHLGRAGPKMKILTVQYWHFNNCTLLSCTGTKKKSQSWQWMTVYFASVFLRQRSYMAFGAPLCASHDCSTASRRFPDHY